MERQAADDDALSDIDEDIDGDDLTSSPAPPYYAAAR
jgi:hypothetical protein